MCTAEAVRTSAVRGTLLFEARNDAALEIVLHVSESAQGPPHSSMDWAVQTTDIYALTALGAGGPGLGYWWGWVLMRTLFLAYRWRLLAASLGERS